MRRSARSVRTLQRRVTSILGCALGVLALATPVAAQVLEPEVITCPQVEGFEATFQYEERVSFNTANGGYRTNCWYQNLTKVDDGSTTHSELILDAYWATPAGDEYVAVWYPPGADGVAITYCSDVDEFTSGFGVTASTNVAVRVTYKFRQPDKLYDSDVGRAAANALREVVSEYARSCDGVEIIPKSSYFTPLPPYLVEALEAAGDSVSEPPPPPATVAATTPPETTTTVTETTIVEAVVAPPSPPPADTGTTGGSEGRRALGFVLLGLSALGLVWTLRRAGKERRVRTRLDVARAVIIAGTAVGTMIVLANTPPWAVAGGVGLGLILAWTQGRNVAVRLKGTRAFERRNIVAIAAFAIGLVVAQGAGLLNRNGVIGIGVGISFLSAATAAGLVAGRRKPLGAVFPAAPVGLLLGGLLVASFAPLLAVAVAQEAAERDERNAAILDDLTAAVAWDEIDIRGGLFSFDLKPLTTISIAPGLTEPPEAITRDVEWAVVPPRFDEETQTWVDADPAVWRNYEVTETFSFSLTAEGVCCSVAYEGEGTEQIGAGEPNVMTGSGTLGNFFAIADRSYGSFLEAGRQPWGLPFGEVEKFASPTQETLCGRSVVEEQRDSAEGWKTTFNGADTEGRPGPSFDMYADCDIAGFDVQSAQALLPTVPPAAAPERDVLFGSTTGTGCPVFQESFNALHDSSMGDAPTDQIRRMMLNPNSTACAADVTIGEEGPGGVRSELHYELATPDPVIEARRQYAVAESLQVAIPAHEIESLCDFDERGIAIPPAFDGEDNACNLRTFHELGGGKIAIWTDYASSDGPNVIIRAAFPWGSYNYRCHHCEADSPEVARIVAAMEVFGNTGLGNFGPDAEVIGSVDAPEGRVGETRDVDDVVAPELIELLTDDPYEAAVLAGLIGMAGVIGLAGVAVAEERLDRKEEDDVSGDDIEVSVWDERKKTATWMTQAEADEWYAGQRVIEQKEHHASAETDLKNWLHDWIDNAKGEQKEAAERLKERLEQEAKWVEWEERIKGRDTMERRQDLLEADSIRKGTTAGWWDMFLDEYSEGVVEDWQALGPELYDAFGNGVRKVGEELTTWDNWVVVGETAWDSAVDLIRFATGDPETVREVAQTMHDAVATVAQVAGTLYAGAEDDPAGAAAGLAKVLLGVENWGKATDKNTQVSERFARVLWGIIETGGTLWGADAAGAKVLDRLGDIARSADRLSDTSRVARGADAAADALRATDRAGDAARTGDRVVDAKRVADPDALADLRAAAKARREVEAAVVPFDDMLQSGKLPPDAWVRNLPSGAEIPRSWLHEAGYSQSQIDELARLAKDLNIRIGSRTTNMDSMRWIRDGKAMPKPLNVKSKTITQLDTYIGASSADEGLVGYFRPRQPDYSKVPDELHDLVKMRYDDRLSEYNKLRGDVTKMITEGKVVEKNGKLYAVAADGRQVPYAGDIDLVYLKNADGSDLSPERYQEVVRTLRQSKASGVMHGAESDVISYYTKGLAPGTPEYEAAYAKAARLQRVLENNHITGKEVVMEMGTDGVLRPGITLYELDTGLRDELGLGPVPIPVRTASVAEIFGGSEVRLDALVSELAEVLAEDYQLAAMCGPTLARLGEVAGTLHALEGRLAEAADLFRIGLRYWPAYVGLNAKLALALQATGEHREAAMHYDMALARRDELGNPMLFIMGARSHADSGDYEGALELLDRCPGDLVEDEGFRDLYLHYAAESA